MSGSEAPQWRVACAREIAKIEQKKVWDLVRTDEIEPGQRPVPGRWVFDKKDRETDEKKYKARWVVRGNMVDSS